MFENGLQLNCHFFEFATANLFLYFRIICFLNILVYFALLLGNEEVNLNYIIGKLFIPIAFIMGVPAEDVEEVSNKKL